MGNVFSNKDHEIETNYNKRKREEDAAPSVSDDVLNTPKRKRIKSTSKYIYQTLFLEGEDSDVTITALHKNWKLHKLYLKQSKYFAGMFSGSWKESEMESITIDIIDENITEESLKIAFGSLYKDDVFIKPVQVIGVLAAATLLQLDGLIQQCSLMMSETLSSDTVSSYYFASSYYGLVEVKQACFSWMLHNLLVTQNITFIKDISLELMEKLVSSSDLFVMQVEIDVYSVLKKYVFLKHHPDWAGETKDLQKSTDQFFKTKLNDIPQCYLELEEGRQFRSIFSCVRWVHVINDMASIKLLENDRIIPIKWLDPVFLYGWRRVLAVEQGYDKGPESLDEEAFHESCTRCGRVLSKASEYCWRWVGYNYGLDILVSYSNRLITLKRNTHTQLCPHAVSLLNQRNLCYRLNVCHLDADGKEKISKTTGIKKISLGKDEEEIAMVLDSTIDYPLVVSMNMMILSPINEFPLPKLSMPD